MNNPVLVRAVFFLLLTGSLGAQFPHIEELSNGDVLFRQFHEDIARFNQAYMRGDRIPALIIYSYTPDKGDDLFTIAARLTLPYETIATLNGLSKSGISLSGKKILLPNAPGIFMRADPSNEIDRLMHTWRKPENGSPLTVDKSVLFFFPGERFHPVERAFFLDILFHFPVESGNISSRYGTRISPISGKIHFHNGIDLAAPQGSRVFAARDGKVIETGKDPVLGIYIVLSHPGGYETVYGHLDAVLVELNQAVTSGMMIGRVGMTGATTGPHLHFEVRKQGESRDPQSLLPRRIQQ
jgi:murein DD-endopeptidase MepM/ murein hydrolase activator NlpD